MPEDRRETPDHPSRPAPRRRLARPSRSQRRRQSSVFRYIGVLFCAAFILLLFTFMMERRQYQRLQEENQDNKQQSVSATQTLNGILEENKQLKEQLEEQQGALEELQSRFARLEDDYTAAEQARVEQSRTAEAMDWFWQINEAYVRGRYSKCRELISSLEGVGLEEYLPKESATNNDRFSPYDRYMEIRNKVIK